MTNALSIAATDTAYRAPAPERTSAPAWQPQEGRAHERGLAFESLRRARGACERARQEVAVLEEVAARLAGPFVLSRAHALWKQLEVAGGSATGRGPGLFERLRAARARAESAEAGLRAAEAELFVSVRCAGRP